MRQKFHVLPMKNTTFPNETASIRPSGDIPQPREAVFASCGVALPIELNLKRWRVLMATAKKAAKKAPAKKAAAKKPAAKKAAPAKKAVAKKAAPAKKAAVKKAAPAKKAAAPKKKRTPNAAFMKALTPSAALAAVVGSKPLARTEVVKKMWDYIKANKLQDQVNKRMVNADAKLKEVFGKAKVSMFEMAGLIGKHLK
jgi:upstream activation factor subunit UAF30